MPEQKVVIIGGGAAGLMAAGFCGKRGLKVTVLEKNPAPGKKLLITGKGRCNVTNNCTPEEFLQAVRSNPKFLYSAASAFPPSETIRFFEGLGVPLKTERGRRVFPASDRAADIVSALVRFAKESGAALEQGSAAGMEADGGKVRAVTLSDGRRFDADAVVLCTGGASYPGTGSTGDGYRFAEHLGHTIVQLVPSLVPLETEGDIPLRLQGLSLRNVTLKILDTKNGRVLFQELGELLFTHFGLSGPLVLSASSHIRQMEPGRYRAIIDLKPALSPQQLNARLLRDFEKYQNRAFSNSLSDLLPSKLAALMPGICSIPEEMKVNQISREMRLRLLETMKAFSLTVSGFRPLKEAIVTSGGVKVSEINPATMESKLVRGLHFAGEVIDCDAYTGGYNLQIAFSTAFVAAGHLLPPKG